MNGGVEELDAAGCARVAEAFAQPDANAAFDRGCQMLLEYGFRVVKSESGAIEPVGSITSNGSGRFRLIEPPGVQAALLALVRALFAQAAARLASERAVALATERLEMLSSASFEGIMIHVNGNVFLANRRLAEMTGYAYEELFGESLMRNTVAPEDLPGVLERLATGYEGPYVITGVRKDGSRFTAELQSKQGKFGERPVRVAAVRDVTEREFTLRRLRESETQTRQLAELAFEFTVFTRQGIIVEVRGQSFPILGLPPEQVVGRSVLDFVAPTSIAVVSDQVKTSRTGSYFSTALRADGQTIPVEVFAIESTLDGVPTRIAGIRDLRTQRKLEQERRELEQGLERAQRIESLGVLAGGIAHDFNNLLVGILGHADLLLEQLTEPGLRDSAEAILTAGQRAAELTKQMLAYAGRAEVGKAVPIGIGPLLDELAGLLAATLSKKARLELHVSPADIVCADRASLTQVFLNLFTNASDALDDNVGTITVTSERVTTPSHDWDDAYGATVGPGNWILLEVRDTGRGMDDATRARIFEPFFTTKPKGHGLGLAACVGIVKAMRGALRVDSTPGQGSCFALLLPAAAEAPRDASTPPVTEHRPCRVLVVDDESIVRRHVRRSLELRGYQVSEAPDGHSGLRCFFAEGADVLLVDMTMPDMDGAEVIRQVRAAGSNVPIVLASGYFDADVQRRLAPTSFQAFLPKPYLVSELLSAISRVLPSAS
jgi:two-component system, cell cycle sensor histidine kinase and response regulator CckA